MNSPTYKNILRVLKAYPVVTSRPNRDFAEFLRAQVVKSFGASPHQTQPDSDVWEEICVRVGRFTRNEYKTAFPISTTGNASGLTQEQCFELLSDQGLEELDKEINYSWHQSLGDTVRGYWGKIRKKENKNAQGVQDQGA